MVLITRRSIDAANRAACCDLGGRIRKRKIGGSFEYSRLGYEWEPIIANRPPETTLAPPTTIRRRWSAEFAPLGRAKNATGEKNILRNRPGLGGFAHSGR